MAANGMSCGSPESTRAASAHAARTERDSGDLTPSWRSVSSLLAPTTSSVISVQGQKTPSTVRPSAARIGPYVKRTWTSSRGRSRSKKDRKSSDQVAAPVRRTPSSIGPMVSQISAQTSRPGRPRLLGCLAPPRNGM